MKPINNVAVLRQVLEMKQPEFAKGIAGCALSTLKMIERNLYPLSDDIAGRLAHRTGVNVRSLFCSVQSPLRNCHGHPYTKADFEKRQAELRGKEWDSANALSVQYQLQMAFAKSSAVLMRAYQDRKFELFAYKLNAALDDLFCQLAEDGMDRNAIVGQTLKCKRGNRLLDVEPIRQTLRSKFPKIFR